LRLSSINGEIDGGKNEEAQYILYRDTYSLQTTAHIYEIYNERHFTSYLTDVYCKMHSDA